MVNLSTLNKTISAFLEQQQKMLKRHRQEIEEIRAQNEVVLKYVSNILLKEEGIDLRKKLEQAKQKET